MDWLGDIGGVCAAIMGILMFLFGELAQYMSTTSTLMHFYSDKALFKHSHETETEQHAEYAGFEHEEGNEERKAAHHEDGLIHYDGWHHG